MYINRQIYIEPNEVFVRTFLDSLLNMKIIHNFGCLMFVYDEMNQIPVIKPKLFKKC